MAKKQTRRSISVSRATYDRLKAFCESSGISMSQFVENRVGDVLSHDAPPATRPVAAVVQPVSHVAPDRRDFGTHQTHAPAHSSQASQQAPAHQAQSPSQHSVPHHAAPQHNAPHQPTTSAVPAAARPVAQEPARQPVAAAPLTSAAARIAVEPPPPVIKPKSEQPAPKPAEKRPDQIFTF